MTSEKPADYYDHLGDRFDEYMSDYDVDRRRDLIFTRLLADVPLAGLRILEVGCGTGKFSSVLKERGARLTVLDIGRGLVRTVAGRTVCPGVVGDACRLPFGDAAFDAVVSSECVEHTPDPPLAVAEMCRVVAPGGFVCLTTPNKLWYPVLVVAQALGLRKFAGTENWIFPGAAAEVMRREGLGGITLGGCHLWPFQLAFTRPLLRRVDRFGPTLYPLMINFGILGRKALEPGAPPPSR